MSEKPPSLYVRQMEMGLPGEIWRWSRQDRDLFTWLTEKKDREWLSRKEAPAKEASPGEGSSPGEV